MAGEQRGRSLRESEKGAIPLTWGGGETFKWDRKGKELRGRFVGLKDGAKGGQFVGVDTGKEIVVASAPKVLADALAPVKVGTKIAIRYTGEEPVKGGGVDTDGKPLLFKQFEAVAIPD